MVWARPGAVLTWLYFLDTSITSFRRPSCITLAMMMDVV